MESAVRNRFQTILQNLKSTKFWLGIARVRRRKNALLIQIGVVTVWDNVDSMNGSWDAYLASPADFAGANDIITNLAKEREPGDIKRTRSPVF